MSASSATLRLRTARRRSLRLPVLLAAGAVAISLIGAFVGTNVSATLAQRSLSSRWETALARYEAMDPVTLSSVTFPIGEPVARISVPTMALDAVVVEGATAAVMRRAPGHLPGSVLPGETGVAILTANRFGFGNFFMRLDRLEPGDRILTQSAAGRTTYSVIEVRTVPAEELDLATDSNVRVLVLFGSSRLWGGGDRIVVRAVAEGDIGS